MVLPEGHDPDSFIHEQGAEKFLEKIRCAKPFIESYIDALVQESPGKTPTDTVKMANQILPLLAKIKNNVERQAWLEIFTSKAEIDDKTFFGSLHFPDAGFRNRKVDDD